MTTMETGTGLVTCPCGKTVQPTQPGGSRPRAHLTPEGGRCLRGSNRTEAICKRCGGSAAEPRNGCASHTFHPQRWTLADGTEVGNAAAAGEVCGVSGEQYGWLTRRPPEGPRRAPAPLGYDAGRRTQYHDLAAVAAYAANRPGIPRPAAEPAE